jgi:integrase
MWSLLDEYGSARIRLAAALAAEGGLRLSEICGVRVQDIDLVEQRCFVSLAKSGRERYAFFRERTKIYLEAWMRERDLGCGHDILLHDVRKRPCRTGLLQSELKRVLYATNTSERANEIGVDSWSFRRLRYTMLLNLSYGGADIATVMMVGGWKSIRSECIYVGRDAARRDNDNAMSDVPDGNPRSSDDTNMKKTDEGA